MNESFKIDTVPKEDVTNHMRDVAIYAYQQKGIISKSTKFNYNNQQDLLALIQQVGIIATKIYHLQSPVNGDYFIYTHLLNVVYVKLVHIIKI